MKQKIAMVCQRYGLEVNGGAELLCRQYAEKLTEKYEVEVFTTCAVDYMTWANEYSPGTETLNGVAVCRFPVEKERNVKRFARISSDIFSNPQHSTEEELKWIEEQGPYCPQLVSYLEEHYSEYQAVIFMTYLYYLTAVGLTSKIKNALLIPTAHDEPPIYLHHYDHVFQQAKGIFYLTEEEKSFVNERFHNNQVPSVITGGGVEVPELISLPNIKEEFDLSENYVLYVGRIDESKGCGQLFRYFQQYKKRNPGNLKLVLVGKAVMPVPKDSDILSLGFVSDEDKFALEKDARLLVLASEFESLSMVVLESMALGRPVLVNGKCAVLKGHCVKSNAGLYFCNYHEFEGALNYLLSHPKEVEIMGENGKAYVARNYRWDVILRKIEGLIDAPD